MKTDARPAGVQICTITIPRETARRFPGMEPMKETVIEIRKPAGSGLRGGRISDGKHTIHF